MPPRPDDDAPFVLPEAERRLWRQVTATVHPLQPCRPTFAPSPPSDEQRPGSDRPAPASAERHGHTAAPPMRPTDPDLAHGQAAGLDKRSLLRLRRGRLRIEGRLDLHGHTQVEAHRLLSTFLAASQSAGRRCVLVITGKGARGEGVLRREVPRWLNDPANRPRVLAFSHATPPDGGEGALYILLRRPRVHR